MRIIYLLLPVFLGFVLSNCSEMKAETPQVTATQNTNKTTPPLKKCHKNPMTVSFYTNGNNPKQPYVVLGKETVSKYNFVGIKRQQASIHDAMRNLAANMGGDAVINITHTDKSVTGTVVTYKQLA